MQTIKTGRFKGFTLAEILVTLGVIGVIAALTIPVLVQNIQDAKFRTGYKKAFASASQAWKMAYNDNLLQPRTSQYDDAPYVNNFNAFEAKFNVVKSCHSSNNSECWANGEKLYNGSPDAGALAFIDNSGMSWSCIRSSAGGLGDKILVDTNALKGPNRFGKDRFILSFCDENKSYSSNGIPIMPCPFTEWDNGYYPTPNSYWCPSGGCYYVNWLKE